MFNLYAVEQKFLLHQLAQSADYKCINLHRAQFQIKEAATTCQHNLAGFNNTKGLWSQAGHNIDYMQVTAGIRFSWTTKSKRIGDKQDALKLLSEQKALLK